MEAIGSDYDFDRGCRDSVSDLGISLQICVLAISLDKIS